MLFACRRKVAMYTEKRLPANDEWWTLGAEQEFLCHVSEGNNWNLSNGSSFIALPSLSRSLVSLMGIYRTSKLIFSLRSGIANRQKSLAHGRKWILIKLITKACVEREIMGWSVCVCVSGYRRESEYHRCTKAGFGSEIMFRVLLIGSSLLDVSACTRV